MKGRLFGTMETASTSLYVLFSRHIQLGRIVV